MGQMIDGVWHSEDKNYKNKDGSLNRPDTSFRDKVTRDGSSGFKAEKDRYHLYVSYACPWAHRTLIFRKLKNLEDIITVSSVHPLMLKNGWEFKDDFKDDLYDKKFLHEIYKLADNNYNGRVTVPVLWDKKTKTIVSNESAEIIRMFNTEFQDLAPMGEDLYPKELQKEIDEVNDYIYHNINNGVYKAGMADKQEAYEKAFKNLFTAMDWVEERLEGQDYLVGNKLTEADIRLFTTVLRFDPVYYVHFKCNLKHIWDYKNISRLFHKLLDIPKIQDTINMEHIKQHYYGSHKDINPKGLIPLGP